MPNGYLALAFIGGFLIGVVSCWLLATKLLKNNKMLDELTRTKRDLASAHRVLDEFFKTSGNLFAQLDKDYRHYARFMSKAAQRLTTNEEELFLTDNEVEYDSEENYSSGRMQTRDIERDAMSLTPERETYRSRRAEKAAPASARETAETAVPPKAQKATEPQVESEEEELRTPEKKVEKK
ncbi:MAG: DUF1043 family protein [Succinivibrio sp.]|nr:DUF1043 family protein [Succinivibrio sp.]